MRLDLADIFYLSNNPHKVKDFLNSLADFVSQTVTMAISPATANVTVADATDGKVIDIEVSLKAAGNVLTFANFTLSASVADTVAHAGTVPSINDTTPTMEGGKVIVKLTLPAGTYLADETITVTLANLSLPDGRTINGGTCVVTIIA